MFGLFCATVDSVAGWRLRWAGRADADPHARPYLHADAGRSTAGGSGSAASGPTTSSPAACGDRYACAAHAYFYPRAANGDGHTNSAHRDTDPNGDAFGHTHRDAHNHAQPYANTDTHTRLSLCVGGSRAIPHAIAWGG